MRSKKKRPFAPPISRALQGFQEYRILLILLPGMDGTGILFEPILSLIPTEVTHEVIPLHKFDSDLPCEQACELATYLGTDEEVIIFAESYSGLIAYELCKLNRNNIKHVFFAAGFLDKPSFLSKVSSIFPLNIVRTKVIPVKILSYFMFGNTHRGDLVDLFYKSLDKVSDRVLKYRLKVIADLTAPTAAVEQSATYICATNDFLVSRKCISRFELLFNNFDMFELDGGHFIAQSNAHECWLAVSRKLAL